MNLTLRYTNKYGASGVYCTEHAALKGQTLEIAGAVIDGTQLGLGSILGIDKVEVCTDAKCKLCEMVAHALTAPTQFLAALIDPQFSHTRDRYDLVSCYHVDRTSPSGVRQVGPCISREAYNQLVTKARALGLMGDKSSPLSPTEGLRGPLSERRGMGF